MIDFSMFPDTTILVAAFAVALGAGLVKGLVGFAMPMIMISGLSSFLSPDLALAGLIVPTLVTNGIQALRQGPKAAVSSIKRFRVFLLAGLVTLAVSTQLVSFLPVMALMLMIGLPIILFSGLQLLGWKPKALNVRSLRLETAIGGLAGFIGGMSGVWGPPTVAYLTALGTEKREQMRVQGVIYGLGAIGLTVGHLVSGILTASTALFSFVLVFPAVLGMWLGGFAQDRIDQAAFRKATLIVLFVAGANLVRRALF